VLGFANKDLKTGELRARLENHLLGRGSRLLLSEGFEATLVAPQAHQWLPNQRKMQGFAINLPGGAESSIESSEERKWCLHFFAVFCFR
jgi:hypothetical protein